MSYTFFTRKRPLTISVLLIGLITAGLGYSVKQSNRPKLPGRVGFTMISTQTFTPNDGDKAFLYAIKVRYQKSNGSWKLVNTYYNPDGTIQKVDTGVGELDHGVFKVDEKKKTRSFLSTMAADRERPSPEDLHNSPKFVREDVVLGYRTYVLRLPDSTDESGEVYIAPELQGLSIKKVIVSQQGIDITEAIKIDIGEPSEEIFNSTRKLPVSYDIFKEKIEAMEKAGRHEAAEKMRRLLQSIQSKPE